MKIFVFWVQRLGDAVQVLTDFFTTWKVVTANLSCMEDVMLMQIISRIRKLAKIVAKSLKPYPRLKVSWTRNLLILDYKYIRECIRQIFQNKYNFKMYFWSVSLTNQLSGHFFPLSHFSISLSDIRGWPKMKFDWTKQLTRQLVD